MTGKDSASASAEIAGARGLKGEFFVRSFTADPRALGEYGPLSNEARDRQFEIEVLGCTGNRLVVRAEGVDDRSAAEGLRGMRLYVDRERLPAPADDEFYYADLIGLQAELFRDGVFSHSLGRVVAVHDFGAAPVLEIAAPGSPSLMVPFTRAAVPEIDMAAGRMIVAQIPGLLGDDVKSMAEVGETLP